MAGVLSASDASSTSKFISDASPVLENIIVMHHQHWVLVHQQNQEFPIVSHSHVTQNYSFL